MSLLCFVLMIVGIVAALIGMKQQKKGAVWGQPVALIGAILAIGCALKNSVSTIMGGNSAASDRELRYQDLQHRFLGNYIKENVPGVKKIGVLVDSYYLYDNFGDKLPEPRQNMQLDGLKAALPDVEFISSCVTPKKIDKSKLPKDANGNVIEGAVMMDPMNTMFTARNIKTSLAELKDCEVIVILGSMESHLQYVNILAMPEMKGKKLCANAAGNYQALNAAFANKKGGAEMLAVSCSKASAIYDDKIPGNDQKAYDRRYILITKDNYTQTIPAAQAK